MLAKLIEENRLNAFKHFVDVIKKQNAETVEVNGDVYSYTTKRGKKKFYKAWDSLRQCLDAGIENKIVRVQTFVFTELSK